MLIFDWGIDRKVFSIFEMQNYIWISKLDAILWKGGSRGVQIFSSQLGSKQTFKPLCPAVTFSYPDDAYESELCGEYREINHFWDSVTGEHDVFKESHPTPQIPRSFARPLVWTLTMKNILYVSGLYRVWFECQVLNTYGYMNIKQYTLVFRQRLSS